MQIDPLVLRDGPPKVTDELPEFDISKQYLRDMFVLLIYKIARIYDKPEVTPEEAKRVHELVDEIVTTKDNIAGKEPPGGFYPRRY
jgi:hypothetical protein